MLLVVGQRWSPSRSEAVFLFDPHHEKWAVSNAVPGHGAERSSFQSRAVVERERGTLLLLGGRLDFDGDSDETELYFIVQSRR